MIGKVVCDRYKIIDHLGTGGMATVWLAEDTILERRVAIKTFKIDAYDEEAIKRFNREANAVTSLSHENIVSIYGVENEEDFYYLILEYVEGMTLKDYMLQNKEIPIHTAVHIMKQIAEGLSHAHKNGIIHRDIKPQNILMTKDLVCKITDFGISRAYGDTTLTQTNQMLGTVYYLSPEQARGNVATAQSDIYSLGILMYELITGRIPFKGESAVAIALKHLQEELPNIDKYRSNIPQSVKNIIIKSTMKNPNERYLSAKEFTDDLITCLDTNRLDETEYKGFAVLNNNSDYTKTVIQPLQANQEIVEQKEELLKTNVRPVYNEVEPEKRKKKSPIAKILIALVSVIVITVGVIFSYNYITNASKVTMPEVKNMTVNDAKNAITSAGLTVGQITTTASDTIAENIVISSDPSSGKKVTKGTAIDLKVSSGKNTIDMPNYLGMTETQVRNVINKVGFKSVEFKSKESDEYSEGKVMEQSITAGKEITPKDTDIIIYISSGPNNVNVPSFIGMTLEAAKNLESNLDLKVEETSQEYSKEPKGTIIRQTPSLNDKVKKGTVVKVIVSKGADPQEEKEKNADVITVENLSKYTLAGAKDWAASNGLTLRIVYNDESAKPIGTIIAQNPTGGTLKKGATIEITVSGSKVENNQNN